MVREDTPTTVATTPSEEQAGQTYPMSREGRRQALLLLVGVVGIWVFALWSLITLLQDGVAGIEWVSLLLMPAMLVVAPVAAWMLLEEAYSRVTTNESSITYQTLGGVTLRYEWEEITGSKAKEGRSRISRFFLGEGEIVDISNNLATKAEANRSWPGENINTERGKAKAEGASTRATAQSAPDDRAPGDVEDGNISEDGEQETLSLRVRTDNTKQIANPLAQFLHRQAHGSNLPIHGGLESRRQLLNDIANHLSPYSNA